MDYDAIFREKIDSLNRKEIIGFSLILKDIKVHFLAQRTTKEMQRET